MRPGRGFSLLSQPGPLCWRPFDLRAAPLRLASSRGTRAFAWLIAAESSPAPQACSAWQSTTDEAARPESGTGTEPGQDGPDADANGMTTAAPGLPGAPSRSGASGGPQEARPLRSIPARLDGQAPVELTGQAGVVQHSSACVRSCSKHRPRPRPAGAAWFGARRPGTFWSAFRGPLNARTSDRTDNSRSNPASQQPFRFVGRFWSERGRAAGVARCRAGEAISWDGPAGRAGRSLTCTRITACRGPPGRAEGPASRRSLLCRAGL